MRSILTIAFALLLLVPAYAQVKPSNQTSALVSGVTKAFFDQIVKDDFDSERAFMSDKLANLTLAAEWRTLRKQMIEDTGPTPRYAAHALKYYQQNQLLAAVDFSAQAAKPNTFICGYLLWELPSPNTIELSRFEQNIVPVDIFRKMPLQDAAQLMTNWRCPPALIEAVLGVSLK